jgi:GT2 family glycosyltransferase
VSSHPLVGVVVLNHNGGDLTLRCLQSLFALTWPAERLRVVLVDNASTDGVADAVEQRYPQVIVMRSDVNLGFAGGCNAGIRTLGDAEYVALLNNDAVAEPGWLEPLVDAVGKSGHVGAAASKVLIDGRFAEVRLEAPSFVPGRGDRRALGVRVGGAAVDGVDTWRRTQLVEGFWGVEHGAADEQEFQWSAARALARFPCSAAGSVAALLLSAEGDKTVVLSSGAARVSHTVGREPRWCEVPLEAPPVNVINSAGVVLLAGGFGADRGYLEVDDGQYQEPTEVFAWSGASVLLSRAYLDDVGLFDERYFLYYEDFDLAWRGRLRGWHHAYVPQSVVHHVHAASTGLRSSLQDHHVERNRLLTLVRDAPAGVAAAAVLRFVLVTLSYGRRDVVGRALRGERPSAEIVRRRLRVLAAFAGRLPGALVDRRRLRRRRQMTDAELRSWMVDTPGTVVGTEP